MRTGSIERQVDREQQIRYVLLSHVQRDLLLVRLVTNWPYGIAVI